MHITIIGGGNIGTLMGAEFSYRGYDVCMCVSDSERWSHTIDVFDANDCLLYSSNLCNVTNDFDIAVQDADWIFVTYPASVFDKLAVCLIPKLSRGQRVCVVPGADAEYFFTDAINRGVELFGLQRVHSIARIKQRGKSVYQLGRKDRLQLASIPSSVSKERVEDISSFFNMETDCLSNYLVQTLTPSNSILHTTRLVSMFNDWYEGKTYSENILFYESWDDTSSRLLIACDEELQKLCRVIDYKLGIDLDGVVPLTTYYESLDIDSMTRKISSIAAFKGLGSPMREIESDVWVPDFKSRYFEADFAIGLRAIVDLAEIFDVDVSHMNMVQSWYKSVGGILRERFVPSTMSEIAVLYR